MLIRADCPRGQKHMSSAITIKKFTLLFILYAVGSFFGHNLLAFTIPVAGAFIFLALPVYGVCFLYLIFLWRKHPRAKLRYHQLSMWVGVACQFLVLIASPRDCFGFKQGADCNPPVLGFAIFLILYLISLLWIFKMLQIEQPTPSSSLINSE